MARTRAKSSLAHAKRWRKAAMLSRMWSAIPRAVSHVRTAIPSLLPCPRCTRSRACKARHRGPTVLPRAASLSCIRRARPTSVSRAQSATPRAHCALPRCVTLAQAESDTDTSLMHSKRDTAGPHFSLTSCSVSRFRMTILSSVSHSDKARAKGPACRTPSQNR